MATKRTKLITLPKQAVKLAQHLFKLCNEDPGNSQEREVLMILGTQFQANAPWAFYNHRCARCFDPLPVAYDKGDRRVAATLAEMQARQRMAYQTDVAAAWAEVCKGCRRAVAKMIAEWEASRFSAVLEPHTDPSAPVVLH